MKKLENYKDSIIISLCKNEELMNITKYLIDRYEENTEHGIFRSQIWTGDNKYNNVWFKRFFVRAEIDLGKNKEVNKIFDEMLVWFCKGYESDDKLSNTPCDKIESIQWTKQIADEAFLNGYDPEYTWEKLTKDDEENLRNGIAPRLAMLDFIWETLQYMSKNEMKEFYDYAMKGQKTNWTFKDNKSGNKNATKKIKDLETGTTYESATECANAIGKSISYISKHKERFSTIKL